VDNIEKKDIWRINRRFLYNYYPAWFLYSVLFSLLALTGPEADFSWFFVFNVATMFFALIIYLFIVIPIILFKPKKPYSRQITMLLFNLLFTAIFIIIDINFLNMFPSSGPAINYQEVFIMGFSVFGIGMLICWLYNIEETHFIIEDRIISERNKKLNNEKMITETYLRLLQAQIEPHFLFNTLTSIFSLTDTDLQKAKKMHNNFMQYIKTTLNKTRSSVTTIGQEVELIKAYLDIFKVRMGKRLQYSVEGDDEVKNLPFPSMLIQPIVENAIKHGLEPKIDGGGITIQIKKVEGDRIRWEIKDTGLGMSEMSHLGTGLSNVIERIEMLYGKDGSLKIKENQPSGVKVILEVPYV
jgi:sensor histidine kinase YesM